MGTRSLLKDRLTPCPLSSSRRFFSSRTPPPKPIKDDEQTNGASGSSSRQKRVLTKEEALERSVRQCVVERDVDRAVLLVSEGLIRKKPSPPTSTHSHSASAFHRVTEGRVFSWSAFSSALYLCDVCQKPKEGLKLLEQVRLAQAEEQRGSGGQYPTVSHGACRTLQRHNRDWTEEKNILSVILRLQAAVEDEEGATQLVSFLIQQKALTLQAASTYIQFICARALEGTPASSPTSYLQRVGAVFEVGRQKDFFFPIQDYVALGKLCVKVGNQQVDATPFSTATFFTSHIRPLLNGLRAQAQAIDQEGFVDQVLKPSWGPPVSGTAVENVSEPKRVNRFLVRHQDSSCGSRPPVCPHCSKPLIKQPFSVEEHASLLKELENCILGNHKGVVTGLSKTMRAASSHGKHRGEAVKIAFQHWKRWLEQQVRLGKPYDLLIDAANVGYYGLSKWFAVAKKSEEADGGKKHLTSPSASAKQPKGSPIDVPLDFDLIDQALTIATESFRRPLLLLHQRHTTSGKYAALLKSWQEKGVVYIVPYGANDDHFWLYGALFLSLSSLSTAAGANPAQAQDDLQNVLVLTNDLCRDHIFQLLSPHGFKRWREQCVIGFHCERINGKTLLRWQWPRTYSYAPQETPLQWDGTGAARSGWRWHLPVHAASPSVSPSTVGQASPAKADETEEVWICLEVTCH